MEGATMNPRMRHRPPGFTLVEMLVVLLLTSIVTAGLYQVFATGRRSHEVGKNLIDMQQNARVAISSLTDDFRHVSYGKDPTQPSIRYAGPDSIVFVADVMTEVPGAEVISYYLAPGGDPDTPNPGDTMLMKAVSDSGGALIFTQPQSYGIRAGGLQIRYFNGGGTELPNPVPQPELIGEMSVDVTTTEAERWKQTPYAEMVLSSTVYPRNLPLSPARSRPSTPACDPPTFPDCSSVTMTWETPTTNTDGTELLLADISHFNFYVGTDPDDLGLDARIARTINTWTVTGLGCDEYYVAVTCVSRSGVESYQCRHQVTVTGGNVPKAPAGLSAHDSTGVKLDWPQVTQFTDDTIITVPVEYLVYRSTTSGFTPDPTTQVAVVGPGITEYVDHVSNDCADYYYVVSARVCCQESAPTAEIQVDRPSPPQCPTSLAGAAGAQSGELDLSWSNPVLRDDLSALPPGEIAATWVYYDTLPGNVIQHIVIPGNGTAAVLTGLIGCKTYYVHARTSDTCGHVSSASCLGNEIAVVLAEPCDPAVPAAPATVSVTGLDERVDVSWPTNTVDCDLEGYKLYYGYASGAYDGTGALEGDSPISLTSEAVNQGATCSLSLTGLPGCQDYYIAVTAYDRCSPPHESAKSPEGHAVTSCVPCNIQAACPSWVATPAAANQDARLELYSEDGTDQILARLIGTWAGTAKITEVQYGRPLIPIWKSDGTAGQDGNVGPRPSGSVLNVTDVTVPSWTTPEDGEPLALLFDTDVRDVTFDLRFKNPAGGFCTADGINRGAAIFDDFDDGNINGWTVRSGTWASSNGELYQSATNNNRTLIGADVLGDITYEGKIKVTSGSQAFLIFRYTDDNNFYMVGIRTDTNRVLVQRMRSGTTTQTASHSITLNNNNWYNLKIVLEAKRLRVWLDCAQVIDMSDNLMNATGKVGFRTASSAARWDDVRCQSAAVLP
jgi:prepilin-type N-terminal cleavage/methylation domain-containing protein